VADVNLFLATTDEKTEAQVLERLKSNNVDSSQLKPLLSATLPTSSRKPNGLHPDKKYRMRGKTYSYALYVPKSATAKMPMIIIMHGMGGNGPNTIRGWMERLGDEFIVLCPTYPMGAWWSKNAEELVLNLIKETGASYNIDPDRVFLAGLSNGAIGAYLMGMFYPDHFAGIVPIAGSITKRYLHFLVNLNNTPTYMIQGEHDPVFPIELARRWVTRRVCDCGLQICGLKHMWPGVHFIERHESWTAAINRLMRRLPPRCSARKPPVA